MTSRRLLDPISKCLLAAADYIEEHGHHKGSLFAGGPEWYNHDGPASCAIGAMVACGEVVGARNKLSEYLRVQYVPAWNDAPERTKEEVVTALREAAIATI